MNNALDEMQQNTNESKNMVQSSPLNKSLMSSSNSNSRRGSNILGSSQLSQNKNKMSVDSLNINVGIASQAIPKQVPVLLLQDLLKNGIQRSDLKYLIDHLNQLEKSEGIQVEVEKFWQFCKNSFSLNDKDLMKRVINNCSVDGQVSNLKLQNLLNAYIQLTETPNSLQNNNYHTANYKLQTEIPRQKVRSSSVMSEYRTQSQERPYLNHSLSVSDQISLFKSYVIERMEGPKSTFTVLDKDLKGYFTQSDFLMVFKNSRSELGNQELLTIFKSLNSLTNKKCGQIDFASFYSFFQMPIDTLLQYLPGGVLHINNLHSSPSPSNIKKINNQLDLPTPKSQGEQYLQSQFIQSDEMYSQYLTPHNQHQNIKSPNRNQIGQCKTIYPQDESGDKQITSYELRRVVKNNPIVRTQRYTSFNFRRNVDPVPSDIDSEHRYGIVKKQVDTMQNLVEGNYGRRWLDNSIANQRQRIQKIVSSNKQSQEKCNENTANLIRSEFIKDNIVLHQMRSVSGQKDEVNNLWKIQKFKNYPGKITTNWSVEEQKRFPSRMKTEGQANQTEIDPYQQELLDGLVVKSVNLIKQTNKQNKSVLY